MVAKHPSCISSEPSPSSANHVTMRLRQRNPERNRASEPHAAEHIEILSPPAGGPQIEVGITDAADNGFFARELRDQPFGEIETVHHLGIARAERRMLRANRSSHAANTLPPVNSGERMKATGARVAAACLIERSMMNSSSSWRVIV